MILASFICLTLTAAICAAVFIFGRQIGYTQRNAELADEQRKQAEQSLMEREQELQQLAYMYDAEQKDKQGTAPQQQGWNPADPFSERK